VPLAAVALRADGPGAIGPADWAAIRFTLGQAIVSAVLSVALAIPVARALARRRFPGRGALITLLGAPFILPVIVAVLGLLAVFGRNGLLADLLALGGLPPPSIYGFHGVVLAHVFFNMPLAVRLILQGWLSLPGERLRLAATLAMTPGAILRHIELPMLRRIVPGIFVAVFLICLTSFAVALTLGGGPRATTVELAIYQALRFDFDLGSAALLSLVQVALCIGVGLVAWAIGTGPIAAASLDRDIRFRFMPSRALLWQDGAAITLAALFLLVPLAFIVADGLPGLARLDGVIWAAAGRSIAVALVSAGVAVALALMVVLAPQLDQTGASVLPLAVSPLVLGTGLFILLRPFVSPPEVALVVTAGVNALMTLPFTLRALGPALADTEASYGRLASSLGLTGWRRLRWLVLPRLRRPLGFSAGLAAALSMGDLGVIALFAGPGAGTLPLAMYNLIGAYQMQAAAGAGLLLVALSLGLFWLFDQGGRMNAAV